MFNNTLNSPAKKSLAIVGFIALALLAPFIAQTFGGNYWVRILDFALL